MLVYVDNVIRLANDSQKDVLKINQVYLSKEGFGTLDRYLGNNIDKVKLEDGRTDWYMT